MAEPLRITYRRPSLYPKQEAAIFSPARIAVIEASTKAGKTHGCIAWLAEHAFAGQEGHHFWWVAPVYEQAKIAHGRLKRGLRGLPAELMHSTDSPPRITLPNRSIVDFKSGEKADNLYGEDVYAAVIDEATRLREDAWIALQSTMTATGGPMRVIGNVKGRKNWAYKLARRAEQGARGLSYAKLTWEDAVAAGILRKEIIEDARANMPEAAFRELYEAEPSEDGGNPFGLSKVEDCVADLSPGEPVVWGWDVARSRDWTVGIALDMAGWVCRFVRFQAPWEITIDRVISETKGTPAYVDATGVGDAIVPQLVQKSESGHFIPFVFTQQSKQALMENLAIMIGRQEVRFPDGPIRDELDEFEYAVRTVNGRYTGVSYSAPPGLHDDCVCALALAAIELRKYATSPSTIYGIHTCLRCAHKYVLPPNQPERPCPKCGQAAAVA